MVTEEKNNDKLARLLRTGMEGDEASYAAFLQGITPLLRRVIAGRVPASDTEDVVQEVLISVHKARHTYDGNRPLVPWLLAIARFRMADHLRTHYAAMRHRMADIADYEHILADVTESPDANESVKDLLKGVPEKQQRILTMMHVEGYTAKQVGERMRMNESAVKVAAHRALKKIRETFHE